VALHAQSGGSQERAFHAVRRHAAQRLPRREAGGSVGLEVVGYIVIQEALNSIGPLQRL
jgi:hypothetical protein